MNYILKNDTETTNKLQTVFMEMAKDANIEIDGAKAAGFLADLIKAFVGNSLFVVVKDATGQTIVWYQFKVDSKTIRAMRSVFAEVMARYRIRISFLRRALFLKRLVDALIAARVFVELEEGG